MSTLVQTETVLQLRLEGITAEDYLCWIRDPEPHELGRDLLSVEVSADPLGDRIDAVLCWAIERAVSAEEVAESAGFPQTLEVVEVTSLSLAC
jgi:hypothetical protein